MANLAMIDERWLEKVKADDERRVRNMCRHELSDCVSDGENLNPGDLFDRVSDRLIWKKEDEFSLSREDVVAICYAEHAEYADRHRVDSDGLD